MSTKSPQDWTDLSADADAEDEALRIEPPPPPRKRRPLLLPSLFGLSLAALAGGLLGPLNPWPSGPSEADLAQGRQAVLQLVDKAVRDYALRNGNYPAKLDDAIVLPAELRVEYVPRPSGFELRIVDGGDH